MTNSVLRSGAPEDVGMDPARLQRARDLAAGWVARGDTPSLVVLVARRGTVVLHEAYGVRHHADTTPTLTRDALFPVSSVTKSITAAAVMCLVEDGLVGLNRAFIDYIPELDVPGVEGLGDASVADLLRHTAGIDDLEWSAWIGKDGKWDLPEPPPIAGRQALNNKLIHLMAGGPLARPPGTAMLYSSWGYRLLGDIVRHVSGMTLNVFAQARLFAPLGMQDTAYTVSPQAQARRVYRTPGMPYTLPSTPWARGIDSPEHLATETGGSSVCTTAWDLAVFAQMLLNGGIYGGRRVLNAASAALMTRDQVGLSTPMMIPFVNPRTGVREDLVRSGDAYGYGQYVFTPGTRFRMNGALPTPGSFGHGGAGGAAYWADPAQGLVGIYLSVSPRLRPDGWNATNLDLFENAVHAAIVD